jgi:hypothetical protein
VAWLPADGICLKTMRIGRLKFRVVLAAADYYLVFVNYFQEITRPPDVAVVLHLEIGDIFNSLSFAAPY